jgi:hypothetical protein
MKKYILIFGAVAGAIIILYSLFLFAAMGDLATMTPEDLQTASLIGYIRYPVLLLGVVMGMVAYRRATAGPLEYRRMLTLGVGVALVTAVFVGLLELGYVAANPDYYDNYSRIALEAMKASGASSSDLVAFRQHQESFAFMKSPYVTGAWYFVETAMVGSLFAAIAALFTKRGESPRSPSLDDTAAPSAL